MIRPTGRLTPPGRKKEGSPSKQACNNGSFRFRISSEGASTSAWTR